MVDLKELRIGNYLNIDGLAAPIGAGWFCASDRGHTLPKHEAIPLTSDWLQRMSFKEEAPGVFVNGVLDLEQLFYGSEQWEVCVREEQTGHTIKYVHQLQNLYFALTGEELEIKETV